MLAHDVHVLGRRAAVQQFRVVAFRSSMLTPLRAATSSRRSPARNEHPAAGRHCRVRAPAPGFLAAGLARLVGTGWPASITFDPVVKQAWR